MVFRVFPYLNEKIDNLIKNDEIIKYGYLDYAIIEASKESLVKILYCANELMNTIEKISSITPIKYNLSMESRRYVELLSPIFGRNLSINALIYSGYLITKNRNIEEVKKESNKRAQLIRKEFGND